MSKAHNNDKEGPEVPQSAGLRNTLKAVIAAELERLPETLEAMEPGERLATVLKLLPFVLPKVQPLGNTYDKPNLPDWDI